MIYSYDLLARISKRLEISKSNEAHVHLLIIMGNIMYFEQDLGDWIHQGEIMSKILGLLNAETGEGEVTLHKTEVMYLMEIIVRAASPQDLTFFIKNLEMFKHMNKFMEKTAFYTKMLDKYLK